MRLIFRILGSIPVQAILCLLLAIGLYFWLTKGAVYCTKNLEKNEIAERIAVMTEELKRTNPEAAAELAKMEISRNERALVATMLERYDCSGTDGLKRLAEYRNKREAEIFDLRLAELAANPRLFSFGKQRECFLFAHALPLQQNIETAIFVRGNTDNAAAESILKQGDDYLRTLREASKDVDLWRRVRDNPMMVYLMQHVKDKQLLAFYDNEKEWIDDALFLILVNTVPNAEASSSESVLQVIQKNHPYFKDALEASFSLRDVKENETEAVVLNTFALFSNYGGVIQNCVRQGKIPIGEVIDAIFANQDFLDKNRDSEDEEIAAKLIAIRDSHPAVWQAARLSPLCLQLFDDAPRLADALCEKYGTDDIATFLYAKYGEAVPQAAAAIYQFGDIAIYILNRYEKSDLFRNALKDEQLGVRIIPYVVQYGDTGLERIEHNKAWLDKYFDEKGAARQKEWWASIPGGGAADVVRNWYNGYPNEWSELGWAALDVADATLLVASLGTSSGVSAVKSTAATGAKNAARIGVKNVGRDVVATIAESGMRQTAKGSRAAAKLEKRSLFYRGVLSSRIGYYLAPIRVGNALRYAIRASETAVMTPIKKTVQLFYQTARRILVSWDGMRIELRRVVYRSLLYTGLAVTLWRRTLPMVIEKLPEMADATGRFLGELSNSAAKSIPALLNGYLDGLLGGKPQSMQSAWIKWAIVIAVLGLLLIWQGNRTYRKILLRRA
ncbi:MAG: hypothetical protein LBT05_12790 [Planctomycetaceae bacterium]|jgi:hypothetical protein|nr:hypothetical protein [Planctomycetaceae bacterium]